MANRPKLIVIPGRFLDAVERLLNTAPPMKSAEDRAEIAKGKRIIERARRTRVTGVTPARTKARKKAR